MAAIRHHSHYTRRGALCEGDLEAAVGRLVPWGNPLQLSDQPRKFVHDRAPDNNDMASPAASSMCRKRMASSPRILDLGRRHDIITEVPAQILEST